MLPITIGLQGRKCVIVGGGKIAWRRTETLLVEGAHVVIISPELLPELAALVDQKRVVWLPRTFNKQDIHHAFLVVAATNKRGVNAAVAQSCHINQLVNIADDPEHSSFHFPAVGRRGLLSIAVGTDGASPVLAKTIRNEIMTQFDESYESYFTFVKNSRERILSLQVDGEEKQQLLTEIADKKYVDIRLREAFLSQLNKQ